MDNSAAAPAGAAVSTAALMDHHDRAAWSNVNKAPFLFRHFMAHHPLFSIPRLARLAERVIDNDGGTTYSDESGRQLSARDRKRRQIDDIHAPQEGQHWLKLASVNLVDAEYDDLLQSLLKEVESVMGIPVRKLSSWAGLTVFMNSPHLEIPYHFDHDTNFLMQIQGEKDVYLFDPHDPWILTEREVEDFYRGNSLAGRYREELKPTRTGYHLSPGLAVHHPPLAPHMITNGSEVSISVAFFFTLPEQDRLARIHQSNHLLRKLGLRPKPPGQSALSDRVKSGLIKACSKSHPSSYNELLYSGVNRITSPTRLIKRIARRIAPP